MKKTVFKQSNMSRNSPDKHQSEAHDPGEATSDELRTGFDLVPTAGADRPYGMRSELHIRGCHQAGY